jgi:curved DNA-binding protein CbpA
MKKELWPVKRSIFKFGELLYFFSMSQKSSFYDILEISDQHASIEELRKNYQRLTLLHHPDKSASTAAASLEKFVKIKQAWETLKDGSLRREYDVLLESKKHPRSVPAC